MDQRKIKLFGPVEIEGYQPDDKMPVVVLLVLILFSKEAMDREQMAEEIWGEGTRKKNELKRYITLLRNKGGFSKLLPVGNWKDRAAPPYQLNTTVLDIDVLQFDGYIAGEISDKEKALGLYRGRLLANVEGGKADKDIVKKQRAKRHDDYIRAVHAVSSFKAEQHDVGAAADVICSAMRTFPDNDDFYVMLGELLERKGYHAQSLAVAQKGIERNKNVETLKALRDRTLKRSKEAHLPLLDSLLLEVLLGEFLNQAALSQNTLVDCPLRGSSDERYVPFPVTFIGRTDDVNNILNLINNYQVVTIKGSGGIGKTQLALEIQRRIRQDYKNVYVDGVWLVSLVYLTNPNQIAHAVAASMGLSPGPDISDLERVSHFLKGKRGILLLDNAEHMLDGCRDFLMALNIRSHFAELKVLVTSREILEIHGMEGVHEVHGLSPNDSLMLFKQRAPQWERRREPNDEAIARTICGKLEGIPLAIELAAARTLTLSLQEINDQVYTLLTKGDPSKPFHQRTMHATLQWSYDLLTPSERALLRRLTVFRGWNEEAARNVCAGSEFKSNEIADYLYELVACSLVATVIADEGGKTRYRLHEMNRVFAYELLQQQDEHHFYQRRHYAYFSQLASEAEPHLNKPLQKEWLDCLDADYDNLCAALDWCQENDSIEEGLQMAIALFRFFVQRGHLQDGLKYLTMSEYTRIQCTSSHLAFSCAGSVAFRLGDFARASSLLNLSLDHPPAKHKNWIIANSKTHLAWIAAKSGEYATALILCNEAISLWQREGRIGSQAQCLNIHGEVQMHLGHYEAAVQIHEQSLVLWNDEECGDNYGIGHAYECLGRVNFGRKDYDSASDCFQKSLTYANSIENSLGKIERLAEELDWLVTVDTGTASYEVLSKLVDRLNYRAYLHSSSGFVEVGEGKVANVDAFLIYAKNNKGTVSQLLEHIEEISKQYHSNRDLDDDDEFVSIMTIHRSKGLQWPVVFVPDCNEGLMPPRKCRSVEEERRLLYVAMTRTSQTLHLLINTNDRLSPFLTEAAYLERLEKVSLVSKAVHDKENTLSNRDWQRVKEYIQELGLESFFMHWWKATKSQKDAFDVRLNAVEQNRCPPTNAECESSSERAKPGGNRSGQSATASARPERESPPSQAASDRKPSWGKRLMDRLRGRE